MAFKANDSQQLKLDDSFLTLNERSRKILLNSWAKEFGDIVFPAIYEERFSVLYSDNNASRPNNPVNAVVGSLILKEMFGLTDNELLENIIFDVRYQYALHTTSFDEQPFSDRTFSRFREKLYFYQMETGIDLIKEEMESMAEIFREFLNINTSLKRMDSLMIASSCKKMSRIEVLFTCLTNMIRVVHRTGEDQLLSSLEYYLKEESKNEMIYHRKQEDISSRLQQVINDAYQLMSRLDEAYFEFPEYQLLERVLSEQTEEISDGEFIPKSNKAITPTSLQNPSDPDATYRSKAGKGNKGYVGNLVETFNDNDAIITSYDYQKNSHSDSKFCKEVIESLGEQEDSTTLLADGAYASTENTEAASKNNIELITTALLGKSPDVIQSHFKIDSQNKEVLKCPAGHTPYKTRYYEKTESFRASFNKAICSECPLRDKCGSKLQKKSAYVMISEKTVQRATYLEKMSSDEYRSLAKKRNGVEGLPSVLRRKYNVDHMPVRGLVRSKIWFGFKIGAINVKRVIKSMQCASKKCICSFLLNFILFPAKNASVVFC
jgi:hypothetical protein